MNGSSIPQLKRRLQGKNHAKRSDKQQLKKNDPFGLSTMASKSSTEYRYKKPQTHEKKTHKKAKPLKRKHAKRVCIDQLPLPLAQNFPNRYQNQQNEQMLSFRQYCMIEGKWIPLITSTQRQRIATIEKPVHKNRDEDKDLGSSENQFLTIIPQNPQPEPSKAKSGHNFATEQQQKPQSQIQEIFTKLEFYYLPNQQVLKQLPQHLKQHYFQLLESLSRKLCPTEQHPMIPSDISPVKSLMEEEEKNIEETILTTISKQIYERECEQLGILIKQHNYGPDTIQTDVNSILIYLDKLFNLVKNQFLDELVDNLQVAYGLRKQQKLSALLKGQSLNLCSQVLNPHIFTTLQQNSSIFAVAHHAAIFDAVNSYLMQYKPHYDSDGECFPWNLYILPSITFYEINKQSMDIVLTEVKRKVTDECSMLCGLLLDDDTAEFLHDRRMQRQALMIKQYLQNQQYKQKQPTQLENCATTLLIKTSSQVLNTLVQQFVRQWVN